MISAGELRTPLIVEDDLRQFDGGRWRGWRAVPEEPAGEAVRHQLRSLRRWNHEPCPEWQKVHPGCGHAHEQGTRADRCGIRYGRPSGDGATSGGDHVGAVDRGLRGVLGGRSYLEPSRHVVGERFAVCLRRAPHLDRLEVGYDPGERAGVAACLCAAAEHGQGGRAFRGEVAHPDRGRHGRP
jgi:hypothetical protein